ncbi:DNA polymerase III subunit beta [Buchnera aphidicola (Hyadaphis tataricae)]|uniref:Beta sliding clamp n=1 Tax=Buchnera aphidicola (Hyadaphis tataricae) TaxID=1241859 RepID=A0A4D6XYT1_9GAMM|nr:DNA polymerase III subunit beta [Buchnera aphidicola]QCI21347.1 DNA polymerase III subunit beta [Buchnera aphidicola (Hyadaphis tataricae)]
MKFYIQSNSLSKYLQKTNRLIVKNVSNPILENILITIHNGILSLTTTNLEIELIVNIKISTKHTPGSTTVSGRKLLDICRHSLESSEIKIEAKENKMYITSCNSKYILNTLPSNTFPNHNDVSYISEFFIYSDVLKNMIKKTKFSMGKEDVRYYLNGVLLEKKNISLYIVGTDGYRLGVSKISLDKNINPFSIIIPRAAVIELYKLLNVKKQLIHVLISKNNIRIHIEELIFTAQLISGEYPDYQSILMQNKQYSVLLNQALLKKSLLRVSILANKNFCGIEINIKNNRFEVLSDNQEQERAEDSFDINYCGKNIDISINVYYILDILNTVDSENILFTFNDANNAIHIAAENDDKTLYVIMLLRR